MPLYRKGLSHFKRWEVMHDPASDVRRISEDWSVLVAEEQVVSLYHHCKGTKGLVSQYITHLGVDGAQTRSAYGCCDLCGTRPDEQTLMTIQMYNVRL